MAMVPGRGLYLKMKLFFEAAVARQLHGLLEVFVGLGGEADDGVGGKADVGHVGAGAVDEVEVLLGGVAAVHHFENAVGATLRGTWR